VSSQHRTPPTTAVYPLDQRGIRFQADNERGGIRFRGEEQTGRG
jgi:hypothetical protein